MPPDTTVTASWRVLDPRTFLNEYEYLSILGQTANILILHKKHFQPTSSSLLKPRATMTESKQRPAAFINGNKTTNGSLTPSTTSSADDEPNAWSAPGSAAFDFRSASSPRTLFSHPPPPSSQSNKADSITRRYGHNADGLHASGHSEVHPTG